MSVRFSGFYNLNSIFAFYLKRLIGLKNGSMKRFNKDLLTGFGKVFAICFLALPRNACFLSLSGVCDLLSSTSAKRFLFIL